jgi:hypothetical protein
VTRYLICNELSKGENDEKRQPPLLVGVVGMESLEHLK